MRKYLLGLSILVCLATVLGLGFKVRASHQATTKTAGTRTASILKLSSSPFASAVKTSATPAKTLLAAGSASTQSAIAQEYGKLPLAFEPNVGQTDPQAKYLARGDGYTLFLTSNEAVLSLVGRSTKNKHQVNHPAPRMHGHHAKTKKAHHSAPPQSGNAGVLRLELAGANASPKLTAQDQLPGITNYFIGTSDNWHTNVPTYRKVSEQGVYPGIDLVYYGSQRQLEYDFVVAPNADPRAIRLSINGSTKLSTSAQGDLMVAMNGGEVSFRKPVAYQWKNGAKQIVASNYKLGSKHEVTFALGNYDATQPLIIDPILAYSTYLGGSNIDGANSIAVASDNTAFVAGGTSSTDFPTAHALQPNDGGSFDFPQDAFVTKFSADGSTLFYSTYLGGKNDDVANGIAVDTAGDAYVVGTTDSPNFPVTFGSVNPLCGSDGECGASLNANGLIVENGFIVKLNPAGSNILYGSFIGEYENVTSLGVAVDANQIAYVTGSVAPYLIPSKTSTTAGISLASVTENGSGTQATYATTATNGFVINQYVTITGVTNNAFNGSFFIVGVTSPTSFVVNVATTAGATSSGGTGSASVVPGPPPMCSDPNAAQIFYGGGSTDAYVFTISATGDSALYCTFLGGDAEDVGNGIAVDNNSNAYVTGLTYSPNFPATAGAFQAGYGGAGDAFLTEVNTNPPSQLPFVYSTHLGGLQLDQGNGIALFETPSKTYLAFVAGGTSSTGLGSAGAFQANCKLDPQNNCEGDAFVAEFNTALSGAASEVFFTYLGGSLNDSASAIALDPSGNIYVTGSTVSTDFPTTAAVFQKAYGGGNDDAFVTEFDPTGATQVYSSYLGGSNTDNGYGIAVDTSGSAYVAGQTCSLDFPLSNPEQLASGGDCDAFISKISILNGIEVNPAGLTFPAQSLETTSATETVTVTNGDSNTTITSIGLTGSNPGDVPGDFAETNTCPGSLTPGEQCAINVTFTPTAAGLRKAEVTVQDSTTGNLNQVVVIDLTGSTSTLTLSASTLSFGSVGVGLTSASQSVVATNEGTSTLTFSGISASGAFSETDNCSAPLQPGTNCTINVVFTPNAAGATAGALTLTDSAPGSPQIVQLTGTGITSTLSISPTTLAFPAESVGVASAPLPVVVTNSGTTKVTITSITASGAFSETDNCAVPLQPTTNCTINVVFTPTAIGPSVGALTITDNAPGSPQIVELTGTGSTSTLALSTSTLAFGSQAVGSASAPMPVVATNTGTTPLIFTSIVASGAFSQTNNCAASIPGGTSCTINVVFTPTAPGATTGQLTFTDNAPGSPQTVQLSGTGVTSTLTLSTFSIAFGNQNVGVASSPQPVTATNNGAATLTFSGILASGAFSETDNCAVPLKTGSSCTINVVFTPTTAGATTGALTLTDNAPGSPQVVQLTGTGITPTPDFTLQSTPPNASISAGQDATFTLLLSAVNGFNQSVELSATGIPQNASLEVSANPVVPGTTTPTQVTLIVKTGARTMLPGGPRTTHPSQPLRPMVFTLLLWIACLMAAGILLTTMNGKLQGQRATAALVFAVMLIMLSAACNSGSQVGSVPGTPAGSYQITVTGTAPGTTHATVLNLQVK